LLETQPTGYVSGIDTAGTDGGTPAADGVTFAGLKVGAGDTATGYTYAEYQDASLGGTVTDSSGTGIVGVTVTVERPNGTVLATATTGSGGSWSVDTLPPGTYQIVESQPVGYGQGSAVVGTGDGGQASGPNVITGVVATSGTAGSGYGFIDTLGSIAGTVFLDPNDDGVVDPGDQGIPNVTVTLTAPSGATTVTTTDKSGAFSFLGLVAGSYTVTETQPAGYAEGIDTAGTDGGITSTQDVISSVKLGAGDNTTGYLFAEEPTGSVSGTVTLDGSPEPGIVMTLTGTSDQGTAVSLTTTVASTGTYSFPAVAPGTYSVSETQPAAYGDGTATPGSLGGRVLADENTISAIPLADGKTGTGYDFTDTSASISGQVFVDNDGSNTFTPGDTGLSGDPVTVTAANGTTYMGSTAANGSFTVGGLPAGTYTVTAGEPAGYSAGMDGAGTTGGTVTGDSITDVTLTPGEAPTGVTFPEYQTGSINGTVKITDGVPETGVTVTAYDAGGNPAGSTTTTSTGTWSITGLVPGDYTVEETQPAAYGAGAATAGPAGGKVTGANEITTVPVSSGTADAGYAFTDTPATLSGQVFTDENGDGAFDGSDTGIGGVTLTLTTSGNATVGTAITMPDGTFEIAGLPAGTYTLTETQPAGYSSGTDTLGNFAGTALTDGITDTGVTVTPGGTGTGYLFPEYTATSLSGTVTDQHGTGIGGVAMTVTNGAGDTVATGTTDGNGTYSISTLPPGTYTITETQPAGYAEGTAVVGAPDGGTVTGPDTITDVGVQSGSTGAGYDFTEVSSTLSGSVFVDSNGDGVQNSGEPGIPNVTISVTDASGDLVGAPVLTAADGSWTVPSLAAGTYTITETQPAGYTSGIDTVGTATGQDDGNGVSFSDVTLGSGDTGSGYTFAEYIPSGLGGTVLDSGGTALAGVPVTISGGGLATPITVNTDAKGVWSVTGLAPGDYTVTETQPAGYGTGTATVGSDGGAQSTADPGNQVITVPVISGSTGTGYDFTDTAATLSGSVFVDGNGDGLQDGTDTGLDMVTVTATNTTTGTSVSTQTVADGSFTFDDLVSGTYTLLETQPDGYLSGTDTAGPNGGTVATDGVTISAIHVAAGSTDPGYTYAEYTATSLTGTVTTDVGGDESGVKIVATDADGNTFTATTGSDGTYALALPPGVYTLTETQPADYGTGTATVGTVDGGDATDGNTISTVTVASGSAGKGYNFTDTTSALSGTVYADTNGDGAQDNGELGIGSVLITIEDPAGNTVAVDYTEPNGTWSVTGLPSGTYTVVESQPTGYGNGTVTAGTPAGTPATDGNSVGAVTLTPGNSGSGYDFADTTASLSGTVFLDSNNDGIQQSGEPGIANVTITATNAAGTAFATKTLADGTWTIPGLLSGPYTVTETQPAGYANGTDTAGTDDGTFLAPDTFTGVSVLAGEPSTGYTFAEQKGTITGQVYLDTNGDQVHEAGETGLGNVTVTLLDGNGNVVATAQTAADGTYSFGSLAPGSYTVVESQPTGYGSDTPNSVPVDLTSSTGANVDFGDQGGTIGDAVWQDTNHNGIRDSGEPGVAGVHLALENAAGTVIATTVSAADGSYSFTNLPAGTYTVVIQQLPTDEVLTTPGKGTSTDTGSAFDQTTLSTGPIAITVSAAGVISSDLDADAGLALPAPDLGIVVSGPTGPVTVGTPVSTTITVTNTGNTTQPGSTLVITVPPNQTVTSATGTGTTCTTSTASNGASTVSCTSTTPLAPGQSAPPVTVVTTPTAPGTTPIVITVHPLPGGGDVVPTNNTVDRPVSVVLGETVTRLAGPTTGSTAGTTAGTSGGLPFTGLDAMGLLVLALISMAGGVGLLLLGRRRRVVTA
jgi:hypothetical protein